MPKASQVTNRDTDDPLSSTHIPATENSHRSKWIYSRRKAVDNAC